MQRCWWAGTDPDYIAYHDTEWGRPVADDRLLFEKLSLEAFQSGLSWLTILRKRPAFREAFAGFDIPTVAAYGAEDVERLLGDAGIVRHRGKIEATLNNARRALEIIEAFGSLAAYLWSYEPAPHTRPKRMTEAVLRTRTTCPEAQALAKDLKQRGWRFFGPTTAYAFMQAMGLVNDHVEGCPCRAAVEAERVAFKRPVARARARQ